MMLSARDYHVVARRWLRILSGLTLSFMPLTSQATHLLIDWQSGLADYHYRTTPLFASKPNDTQWQSSLSLDIRQTEWHAVANLSHNRSIEDHVTYTDATITSLYWQHSLAQFPAWELTLGKMSLDWGVGYGYRPLNIFSNYQRHPVGIQVEQGTTMAMLTHFVDDGSWQWLASRSHYSSIDPALTQQGIGARRYWFSGANEWQALLYWDKQRQWLAGASWVTVLGDSIELHSSLLYQQRYLTITSPNADKLTPANLLSQDHSIQALFGFTWANSQGVQLIGEYWFDSRSWQAQQWQQALTFATHWQNTTAQAIRESYAQGFNYTNVMRHSILLHLLLNQRFWQQLNGAFNNVSTTIDTLFGPADGGVVITPRLNYQLIDTDSSSLAISLSWRYYGGRASAAFANLGDNSMAWLGLTGRF